MAAYGASLSVRLCEGNGILCRPSGALDAGGVARPTGLAPPAGRGGRKQRAICSGVFIHSAAKIRNNCNPTSVANMLQRSKRIVSNFFQPAFGAFFLIAKPVKVG